MHKAQFLEPALFIGLSSHDSQAMRISALCESLYPKRRNQKVVSCQASILSGKLE